MTGGPAFVFTFGLGTEKIRAFGMHTRMRAKLRDGYLSWIHQTALDSPLQKEAAFLQTAGGFPRERVSRPTERIAAFMPRNVRVEERRL